MEGEAERGQSPVRAGSGGLPSRAATDFASLFLSSFSRPMASALSDEDSAAKICDLRRVQGFGPSDYAPLPQSREGAFAGSRAEHSGALVTFPYLGFILDEVGAPFREGVSAKTSRAKALVRFCTVEPLREGLERKLNLIWSETRCWGFQSAAPCNSNPPFST